MQRMKEISSVMAVGEDKLLAQGVTVDELATMLEELQEHVESIDMANGRSHPQGQIKVPVAMHVDMTAQRASAHFLAKSPAWDGLAFCIRISLGSVMLI